MSENKNVDILKSFIATPQSLEAKRAGEKYFLDNQLKTIPNEGNLLSLMTLQKFYKGSAEDEKLITATAQSENKYLMQAMNILQKEEPTDGERKIRQKFGTDFNSAISLSHLLKEKTDERAFRELIEPMVDPLVQEVTQNLFG